MCKLLKIDKTTLSQHNHLSSDDQCFHIFSYRPKVGFNHGSNSLILNFKKSMDRKSFPEWRYKAQAIKEISKYFRDVFPLDYLLNCTLIPIPPSKIEGDILYDDRMLQVLNGLYPNQGLDIRPLLQLTENYTPSHISSSARITPQELKQKININTELLDIPLKNTIIIFDDVIAAGTHFKACKEILLDYTPSLDIYGVFVARREIIDDAALDFIDID